MSSKKKDLEIVYSLRWKNGPKKEDKKETSIVVIFDIPATTMNFEVFKNYLLKNSGIAEDDVTVSFIMDNGKVYSINSQVDFQVALYAFRRKARVGEVINLLLEQISHQPNHKNLRHSNDVETQFDNAEPQSLVSACCNFEAPPDWFIAAIAQLKKEIKDEVTANISGLVANAVLELKKPLTASQVPSVPVAVCPQRPRNKREKCLKKIGPYFGESASEYVYFDLFNRAKHLLKSVKLENKLEKLELKASKYREKRMALQHILKTSDHGPKSSDSEAGPSSSRRDKKEKHMQMELGVSQSKQENVEGPKMDARPVTVQSVIPHMLGGEIYMHQWEVQNTGEDQWTSLTQLQYTWGSRKLVPVEKIIGVPYLKPGEKGVVSVRLHIPIQSGQYECYWQFTHKGRRFGHWLGAQVIVDAFDLKGNHSVLQKSNQVEERENVTEVLAQSAEPLVSAFKPLHVNTAQNITQDVSETLEGSNLGRKRPFVPARNEDDDSDCSWNSQQFWSKFHDKGDFVVVPHVTIPQCYVMDTPECSPKGKIEQAEVATDTFDNNNNAAENNSVSAASGSSIKLRDEDLDNIVVITVPKDEQVKEGFIYVHVDGQKVLIPKNILKTEVVTAAQELESSPSSAKSVGVIIDSAESSPTNKSPTPSSASTFVGASSLPREPAQRMENFDGNTLDSVPMKTLQEPLIPQQAIDLSIVTRDALEESEDRGSYLDASNYMSHCSAAGSCFSEVNSQIERQNRVFVFPQSIPGYEVVYPVLDIKNPDCVNVTTNFEATAPQPEQPIMEPVPNYQQTPPEQRVHPENLGRAPTTSPDTPPATPPRQQQEEVVHLLPEALVTGAVNVASSALNTARSVINMIKPQSPGGWVNGRWVSASPDTPREANLQALAEMGFWNRDQNATLLARFEDDINRVVAELVQ
ncbi:uncharacterized protein [Euwallacea similis]|uniref:uncharacterized protein isoform X1 n=1 Tax=Euwallacea similis TaxID=1736056 RepID=UPI00344B4817